LSGEGLELGKGMRGMRFTYKEENAFDIVFVIPVGDSV